MADVNQLILLRRIRYLGVTLTEAKALLTGATDARCVEVQHVLFLFNDTATTEIYTLSLHDALPIYAMGGRSTWVGGSTSGRAGIGSHGVSCPAHGSTAGVAAHCVTSAGAGSSADPSGAAAVRRRDHRARFGPGGGTAAEALQRAGASTVDASGPSGSSRVGSTTGLLSSGSPAAGVFPPGCWSAIGRSPPGT